MWQPIIRPVLLQRKKSVYKNESEMCLGHGSIGRRGNVSYTEGCFLYAFELKKNAPQQESNFF